MQLKPGELFHIAFFECGEVIVWGAGADRCPFCNFPLYEHECLGKEVDHSGDTTSGSVE